MPTQNNKTKPINKKKPGPKAKANPPRKRGVKKDFDKRELLIITRYLKDKCKTCGNKIIDKKRDIGVSRYTQIASNILATTGEVIFIAGVNAADKAVKVLTNLLRLIEQIAGDLSKHVVIGRPILTTYRGYKTAERIEILSTKGTVSANKLLKDVCTRRR